MSLLIKHFYRFGEFTLDTEQRVLLHAGQPLPLAPKVLETLLVLVEQSGRIVEKEELMKRLWPDTFVEESNLTYTVVQLRKSLGDDARHPRYIETVARRGYRFIAEVEEPLNTPGLTNGQIPQHFEPADLPAPIVAQEFKNEPTAPASAAAPPSIASRSGSKKSVALAAVAVIVLAGAGLVYWVSNGAAWVWGRNDKVESKLAAPLKLEKLTGTGQSRQVAISPDGKYIAYTRRPQGKWSLWLRQLATNTNVEIIPPTGAINALAFAHSGESLFFVRYNGPVADSVLYPSGLYRVSLLGGVPTKMVDNLQGNFSISADGSQVAFIRVTLNRDGQRECSLMTANVDGTGERSLLTATYPNVLSVPVWSPASRSIICAQGDSHGGGLNVSLIEVSLANGTKKELSPERFFHISKMAWLLDKGGLLISARKNAALNNQLWRVSYPGLQISRITEDSNDYLDLSVAAGADLAVVTQTRRNFHLWVGSSREPQQLKMVMDAIDLCWAPDGRIVYTSEASGYHNVWVMQPDGTAQRQLTVSNAFDEAPVVTPDNRYIVFVSTRSGVSHVWRMEIDGSNQIELTHSASRSPTVSPDGKWVLYNTTNDWRLWRVALDGGPAQPLTEYMAIRPAVSPDGKMIACQTRTGTKRELLIMPFEGGQPLKRFELSGWDSRLQWTPDGQALIYKTKLNEASTLVKQLLSGGQPQPIVSFGEDELFNFGYSFDGKFLAVTRGNWQHDIVLISELK